jgi:ABC-type dipeptide/oligopeptide/nickel transport system permease subunit
MHANNKKTDSIPEKKTNDYKLERYKFILQQLNSLNEGTHKYISLFQTLATAVLGVGIAIFAAWKELKIDAATARLGIEAVLGLFTILSVFVTLSIFANAISWFDYRNEEVRLLNAEIGEGFRESPNWKNIWRWNETYFVFLLVVFTFVVWIFTKFWILPNIG